MGQRVHVLLDRIDRQQRRLQFALVPTTGPPSPKSTHKGKTAKAAVPSGDHISPDRSGKPRKAKGKTKSKARSRDKKPGKRK
jgi:ribonuclease R